MSSGSFAVTAAAMGAPGNGEHDDTSKDQQPASHVRSLSATGLKCSPHTTANVEPPSDNTESMRDWR
jgi:hypothetical protein